MRSSVELDSVAGCAKLCRFVLTSFLTPSYTSAPYFIIILFNVYHTDRENNASNFEVMI